MNKTLERVVLKSVAGFLNSKAGGTLLIGVNDDGTVAGLEADYASLKRTDRDAFENHLMQLLVRSVGETVGSFLTITFHDIDGKDICQVAVEACDHPVYIEDDQGTTFYLRIGNATKPMPVNEAVKYIGGRWGRAA